MPEYVTPDTLASLPMCGDHSTSGGTSVSARNWPRSKHCRSPCLVYHIPYF